MIIIIIIIIIIIVVVVIVTCLHQYIRYILSIYLVSPIVPAVTCQ